MAKATAADKDALGRLLTALSTLGICSLAGEDRYSLTELGAGLDGDAEHSFKHWAIFEGEMLSKRWNGLLESIMTGKTAAEIQNVANSFDLMARTPENVTMFNAAMTDMTRLVTPDVLRAYDFGAISHLMDVGGGSGELIGAVATVPSTSLSSLVLCRISSSCMNCPGIRRFCGASRASPVS